MCTSWSLKSLLESAQWAASSIRVSKHLWSMLATSTVPLPSTTSLLKCWHRRTISRPYKHTHTHTCIHTHTYVYTHMPACLLSCFIHIRLCDPMDSSPLVSSSVHGILQARIQEWVAIPFSRGSSQPRDQTGISCVAGRFFMV